MLVLARKQNQTVVIDNQIEIEVLKIKGNTVRLGIKAPNNIKILRGELAPFEIEVDIDDLDDNDGPTGHSASDFKRSVASKSDSASRLAERSNAVANPFAIVAMTAS